MPKKQQQTSLSYVQLALDAVLHEMEETRQKYNQLLQTAQTKHKNDLVGIAEQLQKKRHEYEILQQEIGALEQLHKQLESMPEEALGDKALQEVRTYIMQLEQRKEALIAAGGTASPANPTSNAPSGIIIVRGVLKGSKGWHPRYEVVAEWRCAFTLPDDQLPRTMLSVAKLAFDEKAKFSGITQGTEKGGKKIPPLINVNILSDAAMEIRSDSKGSQHIRFHTDTVERTQQMIQLQQFPIASYWRQDLVKMGLIVACDYPGVTEEEKALGQWNLKRWREVVIPHVKMWIENPK